MKAVQCKGCGAFLSIKGLVNCPRCQAYLDPPDHAKQNEAKSVNGLKMSEWLGVLALIGIAAMIALIIKLVFFPSAEKTREDSKRQRIIAALTQCQNAIKSTAKYGGAESPPYAQNHGSGDEFYFAWPTGSFHFTNGFGAREKMSASCIGSLSTGSITQLTINGKDAQ